MCQYRISQTDSPFPSPLSNFCTPPPTLFCEFRLDEYFPGSRHSILPSVVWNIEQHRVVSTGKCYQFNLEPQVKPSDIYDYRTGRENPDCALQEKSSHPWHLTCHTPTPIRCPRIQSFQRKNGSCVTVSCQSSIKCVVVFHPSSPCLRFFGLLQFGWSDWLTDRLVFDVVDREEIIQLYLEYLLLSFVTRLCSAWFVGFGWYWRWFAGRVCLP